MNADGSGGWERAFSSRRERVGGVAVELQQML
jgi:hypothetical protein